MLELIKNIDIQLIKYLHDTLQSSFLDRVMPLITMLGNNGGIWMAIGTILMITKRYRKTGLLALCALLLATILGDGIIKHLVQRPRPFEEIQNISLLIPKLSTYSFPSGHAAAAFAFSGVMLKRSRKYGIPLLILAVLISFSRAYLFVHYISDVLAGAVLGIICSQIVLYYFEKYDF